MPHKNRETRLPTGLGVENVSLRKEEGREDGEEVKKEGRKIFYSGHPKVL